jgi:hypothetical protein
MDTLNRIMAKNKNQIDESNLLGQATKALLDDTILHYDAKVPESVKASRKFHLLKDWRAGPDKTNFFVAFITGRLRPHDYHILLSFFAAIFLYIIMGLVICLVKDNTSGISWGVAFIHCTLVFGMMARPLACDAELSVFEAIVYIFAYLMFEIWAYLDFWFRFDFEADDNDDGAKFLVWYIQLIPICTMMSTSLYKWYDHDWKFSKFVLITIIFGSLLMVAMIVFCYIFIGPISGSVVLGILAAIIYGGVLLQIYVKNDNYLPWVWKIINLVVLLLCALATFVVSLAVDGINVFLGFSVSYGIVVLLILLYAGSDMYNDLLHLDTEPLYFSPWIVPAYKYNAKKKDLMERSEPALLILLSLLLALGWSLGCAVWVTPYYAGISVSCLVEVLIIIFVLFLISLTPGLMQEAECRIDQLLIKQAWLESKDDYVKTKNISTADSMTTFSELAVRITQLRKHIKDLAKGNAVDVRVKCEWNAHEIDQASITQCRRYLYKLEQDKTDTYQDELGLIVQFELLIILCAEALAK